AVSMMEKEVKKGHCVGPFDQCPFPNQWCGMQAVICRQFFIPKHKLIKSNEVRLIGDKSCPDKRAFNDLVTRRDCKAFIPDYEYIACQMFLAKVAQAGKFSLISLFDVKDAYKHCRVRHDHLWQQAY